MNENDFKTVSRKPFYAALLKREFWCCLMVLTYFAAIWIWNSPKVTFLAPIFPSLARVLSLFGLKQHWALFGPNSTVRNMHHLAKITFADGTTKLYEWPRVELVSDFEKSLLEPYSKLFSDNLPAPGHARLRVSVARFVARANITPGNQPSIVTLIDVISDLPDAFVFYHSPVLPPHTRINTEYIYQVRPEDLL